MNSAFSVQGDYLLAAVDSLLLLYFLTVKRLEIALGRMGKYRCGLIALSCFESCPLQFLLLLIVS